MISCSLAYRLYVVYITQAKKATLLTLRKRERKRQTGKQTETAIGTSIPLVTSLTADPG